MGFIWLVKACVQVRAPLKPRPVRFELDFEFAKSFTNELNIPKLTYVVELLTNIRDYGPT